MIDEYDQAVIAGRPGEHGAGERNFVQTFERCGEMRTQQVEHEHVGLGEVAVLAGETEPDELARATIGPPDTGQPQPQLILERNPAVDVRIELGAVQFSTSDVIRETLHRPISGECANDQGVLVAQPRELLGAALEYHLLRIGDDDRPSRVEIDRVVTAMLARN